jgi:hypothetical protein
MGLLLHEVNFTFCSFSVMNLRKNNPPIRADQSLIHSVSHRWMGMTAIIRCHASYHICGGADPASFRGLGNRNF